MYYELQSPFEQLWSLLNFAPEKVFETVGEVRACLIDTEDNLRILKENAERAQGAVVQMSSRIVPDSIEAIMTITNIQEMGLFMDIVSDMLENCLERDLIAMRVFLDVAAGSDPSLN